MPKLIRVVTRVTPEVKAKLEDVVSKDETGMLSESKVVSQALNVYLRKEKDNA